MIPCHHVIKSQKFLLGNMPLLFVGQILQLSCNFPAIPGPLLTVPAPPNYPNCEGERHIYIHKSTCASRCFLLVSMIHRALHARLNQYTARSRAYQPFTRACLRPRPGTEGLPCRARAQMSREARRSSSNIWTALAILLAMISQLLWKTPASQVIVLRYDPIIIRSSSLGFRPHPLSLSRPSLQRTRCARGWPSDAPSAHVTGGVLKGWTSCAPLGQTIGLVRRLWNVCQRHVERTW